MCPVTSPGLFPFASVQLGRTSPRRPLVMSKLGEAPLPLSSIWTLLAFFQNTYPMCSYLLMSLFTSCPFLPLDCELEEGRDCVSSIQLYVLQAWKCTKYTVELSISLWMIDCDEKTGVLFLITVSLNFWLKIEQFISQKSGCLELLVLKPAGLSQQFGFIFKIMILQMKRKS